MKEVAKTKKRKKPFPIRRVISLLALGGVVVLTIPTGQKVYADISHDILINTDEYKAQNGKWDLVDVPEDLAINAIHSAILPTGKVLLIAGSGNDRQQFEAGTFESMIYDPETGATDLLSTPEDMFCSGHVFLPNGNLLVAGGTQGYEVLPEDLTRAGGYLTLRNENPDQAYSIPKGTEVVGQESGLTYRTDADVTVPAASKNPITFEVSPTDRNVYVESTEKGDAGVREANDQYMIVSFSDEDKQRLHGFAPQMSLEKKEYQGIDSAYEFDPWTEEYIKVNPMHYARWYPSLLAMPGGHIMALSGLDNSGRILDGQIEIYNSHTRLWSERDDLRRFFPTYPSVFQTAQEGVLFSAGPSTGWGPAEDGRDPGFWQLDGNVFTPVTGLRDPDLLETGSATWLGPVNDQRIVVVGGGGVGDSAEATGRIDVIDLDSESPAFQPLGDLPQITRYPNLVTLPTGDVFITNGAEDYRGRGASDILKSYLLDHHDGSLDELASPTVGRNYHSSALLLPDGRILTAGSDPLYQDEADTIPGKFDRRIEIYSPPYLYDPEGGARTRPVINVDSLTEEALIVTDRTISLSYKDSDGGTPADIASVRLSYPGAVTHVTDTNQRLIDLDFTVDGNEIEATIPDNPALMPPGHYMLFLVDSNGVPSVAEWVRVGEVGYTDPAVIQINDVPVLVPTDEHEH